MAFRKSIFIISSIALLSILGYFFLSSKHELTPLQIAPEFQLFDLAQQSHQLSDYRGKTLIINFWASWCAPCRKEIPSMNRANERLKQSNVVMLAINYGEDANSVKKFISQYPIDFTVLLDTDISISQSFDVRAMPTTVIINGHGEIVERVLGIREWDSDENISALLRIK